MKQNEDRAYGYLKKVATAAGYSSPDDYVNNVLQLVPEGERTKFQKLRDQLTKENKDCGTALDVLGGVASLCVIAGGLCKFDALTVYLLIKYRILSQNSGGQISAVFWTCATGCG